MRIAFYSDQGDILRIVSCDASQAENQQLSGEEMVEVGEHVSDATHYISNGQAVEKSPITPSVSIDGDTATVTGIPPDLEVSFDGVIAITDDEPLELTVDEPDAYTLRIDGGAKYFDTEVEIDFG
jgi:hypothetical protein